MRRGTAVAEETEQKKEKVTREKKKSNWEDDEGDYVSEEEVRERRTGRGRERERARDDSDESDSEGRREREKERDERNRLEREEDDNSPEADLIDHQKIMVSALFYFFVMFVAFYNLQLIIFTVFNLLQCI